MEDAADQTPGTISRESLDKVYRFALRRTSSTEDAQDVAQDIAVELVRSLPCRKGGGSFDAWMWTIANRTFWRWLDQRRRRVALYAVNALDEEVLGTEDSEPEREIERREELGLLRREIALLASAVSGASWCSTTWRAWALPRSRSGSACPWGLSRGAFTRLADPSEGGCRAMRANGREELRARPPVDGHERDHLRPPDLDALGDVLEVPAAEHRARGLPRARHLGGPVPGARREPPLRGRRGSPALRAAGHQEGRTGRVRDRLHHLLAPGQLARPRSAWRGGAHADPSAPLRACRPGGTHPRRCEFHGSSFEWSRLLWLLAPWTILESSRLLPGRIGYRVEYPRRPNGAWFLVGFEAGQDDLPLEGGLSVSSDSDPQGGAYKSCIFWTNAFRHSGGNLTLGEARVASRLLGGPVEAAALGGSERETIATLASRGYVRRVDGRVAFDAVGFTRAQHDALGDPGRSRGGNRRRHGGAVHARLRLLLEGSVPSRLHPQSPQRLERAASTLPGTCGRSSPRRERS